jgi:hypothetical protein
MLMLVLRVVTPCEIVGIYQRFTEGRSMAQAVSRHPLAMETQISAQVNPCGICSEQCGTGTGFSLSYSVLRCQYHSTMALHIHISSEG